MPLLNPSPLLHPIPPDLWSGGVSSRQWRGAEADGGRQALGSEVDGGDAAAAAREADARALFGMPAAINPWPRRMAQGLPLL